MCKKILIFLIVCGLISWGLWNSLESKKIDNLPKDTTIPKQVNISDKNKSAKNVNNNMSEEKQDVTLVKSEQIVKSTDLYSEDNTIPFLVISQMADFSPKIKENIDSLIDDFSIFYLKKIEDKIILIVGNSGNENFLRHDIQFVEISENGEVFLPFGKQVEDETSKKYNKWVFDDETKQPISHIRYNTDGNVEYSEYWYYSIDNPIKYEMKNSNDKTVSIRKEITVSESNSKTEHIFYDDLGKIKLTVSINYEGPNITRFTYYNADRSDDGVTLISDFSEGLRLKETVYSTDYKKIRTYKAEYQDGERSGIKVFDSADIQVEEILPL